MDCVVFLNFLNVVYVSFPLWGDLIYGIDVNWKGRRLEIDPVRPVEIAWLPDKQASKQEPVEGRIIYNISNQRKRPLSFKCNDGWTGIKNTWDFSGRNKSPLGCLFLFFATAMIAAGSNNCGRVIGPSSVDLMYPFTLKTKARSQWVLMFSRPPRSPPWRMEGAHTVITFHTSVVYGPLMWISHFRNRSLN